MKNLYPKLTSYLDLSSLKNQQEERVLLDSSHNLKEESSTFSQDFLINDLTLGSESQKETKNVGPKKINQNLHLNKKIYLVVNESAQSKNKENILLLLHPQDRLNAEDVITDHLNVKYAFYGKGFKHPYARIAETQDLPPHLLYMRRNKKVLSKYFFSRTHRLGQNYYYVDKEGGYKSICPVFSDSSSAEHFLRNVIVKQQGFHKGLPKDSIKKNRNGVLSSKVISISLKDFFETYYPSLENKGHEKIEFLFFPPMKRPSFFNKINPIYALNPYYFPIFSVRKTESFKSYQQKYYAKTSPSLSFQEKE